MLVIGSAIRHGSLFLKLSLFHSGTIRPDGAETVPQARRSVAKRMTVSFQGAPTPS